MAEWIVSSAALILVVVALRFVLRGKISARLQYALWALVLARLLLPVSLGVSGFSAMKGAMALADFGAAAADGIGAAFTEVDLAAATEAQPVLPADADGSNVVNNNNITSTNPIAEADAKTHAAASENGVSPLLIVWLCGAAAVGAWFLATNLAFAQRMKTERRDSVPLKPGGETKLPVYVAGGIVSPCLFGVVSPAVYVPASVAASPEKLRHVLAHEEAHRRHGDNLWALLRGLALALHWYNPLVWWAAVLSRRDAELCCDECAIKSLGETERTGYGRTLIGLVAGKTTPAAILSCATTMTDGGRGIRERIKFIAEKPKMAAVTLVLVLLIAAAAVGYTFTGAGKSGSTLQYIELTDGEQAIAAMNSNLFSHHRFEFDDDINGVELYLEEWAGGEKIHSQCLMARGTNDALELWLSASASLDGNDVTWSVMYEDAVNGGSSRVQLRDMLLTMPDGEQAGAATKNSFGKDSARAEAIVPGKSYILTYMSFSIENDYLHNYQCEELSDDESLLAGCDCVMLVRAVFRATEEETQSAWMNELAAEPEQTDQLTEPSTPDADLAGPLECVFLIIGQTDTELLVEYYDMEKDTTRYVNQGVGITTPYGQWIDRFVTQLAGEGYEASNVNLSVLVSGEADENRVAQFIADARALGVNVITDEAHAQKFGWRADMPATFDGVVTYLPEDRIDVVRLLFLKAPVTASIPQTDGTELSFEIDGDSVYSIFRGDSEAWQAALAGDSWQLVTETETLNSIDRTEMLRLQNGAGDVLTLFESCRFALYSSGGAVAWFEIPDAQTVNDAVSQLLPSR